ncbi:MAG: hypothetical protein WCY07_07815 [Pigmentiphaga sp.]
MSVPGEPENDAITAHVIDVFLMASKARQYAIGMGVAAPLPLSVADISAVLDVHPSPLPREELDACLFALDAQLLESVGEKPDS